MPSRVLVIGDSLAGLSTAFRLYQEGFDVSVLARNDERDRREDPLLLWGCHRATRSLLDALGRPASQLFRKSVSLELLRPDGRIARWHHPWLPAPFHALVGLAVFSGLPVRDRYRFLMWVERTWEKDPALPLDLEHHPAEAWLRGIGQSEAARLHVWTPLARFLLGDDVRTVSAASLLSALIRCFQSARADSRAAACPGTVEERLVTPLRHALQGAGVPIHPARVDHIRFDTHRAIGVQLKTGETLTADWYVAALPHGELTPVLPERAMTRFSYFQQLAQLRDTPLLTLRSSQEKTIGRPRLIVLGKGTCQWIWLMPMEDARRTDIVCRLGGHKGRLDFDEQVLQGVRDDLAAVLPPPVPPTIINRDVACYRSASLTLAPGTTPKRPLQQSPFANFFLVGEWTDTGWPANVESAVVSAELCVKAITAKAKAALPAGG